MAAGRRRGGILASDRWGNYQPLKGAASRLDGFDCLWERAVVEVIEGKEEAFGAKYIEFKVHRSETDPGLILGSWRFAHGSSTLIDQSTPDSPVATEFRLVVDCADQHGIPFVWVNDPDELFPPWERR
jgi:hypothetical protein